MGYAHKVVVIGAGLSGLTCAYRLKQLGVRAVVLEAMEHAGGVIATARRNGFLFEAGPQCPRFPAPVWALVKELSLEKDFVYGDPKVKRYILRQGQLHPAPFSPVGLVTTRLVDSRSKLRFLTEAFGNTRPPEREESLAEFVERKFGTQVLEYLVDPVISTVFLGDSRKMGMQSAFPALVEWERSHGSLVRGAIRGSMAKRRHAANSDGSQALKTHDTNRRRFHVTDALPSLGSFRSGMAMLPEKLSEALGESMKCGAKAESVAPVQGESGTTGPGWRVRLSDGGDIAADSVVLAVPAYAAARLLENSAPQLSTLLGEIEYAPMCSVSLAYERDQVSHPLDGFGFMVPRREGLNTICTFWNSGLFAGRAPEGKVLITSFAGRDSNELAALPDAQCARTIHAENARILGIRGEPLDQMVWRYSRALPQYNVGHAKRVAEIQRLLGALPSLRLAGNYLTGRSLGDCAELASRVAQDLNSRFQESNI